MYFRRIRRRAPLVAFAVSILACRAAPRAHGNAQEGEPTTTRHTLDWSNRSVTQSIDPSLAEPEKKKFVELNVTSVVNPEKHPLIFEVHFREDDDDKQLLGSFSLFPPDNPGKFIVATRGRLRTGGTIVVTLQAPDRADPDDDVRVELEEIRFRDE